MSNPQHEPTMEEILASIRKIISEDSTEEQPAGKPAAEAQPAQQPVEAVQAEAAPAEPLHEPEAEADDVLELTEELPEEPVPAPELPADEVVFQTIEEEILIEPEPAMVELEDEPAAVEAAAPSDIFSDRTRRALDDAFANIEPEEDETPAPVSVAASLPGAKGRDVESVFEGAVREAFDPVLRQWLGDQTDAIIDRMKPVIRQWMDEHFPPMLEEAVRNEVARVAKTRRR